MAASNAIATEHGKLRYGQQSEERQVATSGKVSWAAYAVRRRATAHANDPAVLHADIEPAAVGAQDTGGLNPSIRLFRDPVIDPFRPLVGASERRSDAPNVMGAVAALGHSHLQLLV